MPTPQKTVLIGAVILIIVIIVLGFVIAWQKSKLLNFLPGPILQQTKTDQADVTTSQETETELSEKQQIIKELAPESDLYEFDVPEVYLQKDIINNPQISPAFNRSGRIIQINPAQKQFTFRDDSLGEIKEYQVKVDGQTKITINITQEIYQNSQSQQYLELKNYSSAGNLADLAVDDVINIRARQIIGGTEFIAEFIDVNRSVIKFLE